MKLLLIILLLNIPDMSTENLYDSRYERAIDHFGIDVVKPALVWVDEDTYVELLNQRNLTTMEEKDVGFYSRGDNTIYMKECHKDSPKLTAYFDHELAHHFYYKLPSRVANEYFAVMYEELNK